MTDKERFLNEIKEVKLIIQANRAQGAFSEGYLIGQESVLEHFEKFADSMKKEPISEDLEKASIKYAQDKYMPVQTSQAFKAGAKWQRQQMKTNGFEIININRRTLEYIYDVCKGVMPSKELFIKCVMGTIKED